MQKQTEPRRKAATSIRDDSPRNLSVVPTSKTAEVERLLAEWQRRLGLERWQIVVDWDEPTDEAEALAEIEAESPYDYARLRLSPDWSHWDRRWLNLTLVHELCHLLVRELWPAVESVEEFVPVPAWRVFRARFEHVEEQLVDRLATLYVDHLGIK
jgi:hypothetical protein